MRRTPLSIVSASCAVLALVGLTAVPSQASEPTFFFDRSFYAYSGWYEESATQQVTTGVAFYTGDRSYPTPGPRETLTYLSYWQETKTWNGAQWLVTSQTLGRAATDIGGVITYKIGQGGRSITASATVALYECLPAGCLNAPQTGSAQLNATWISTGPPTGAGGFHVTGWWGWGCDVDFASGSSVGYQASINAALGGVPIGGVLQRSEVSKFNDVEVNFCVPAP